MDKLLIGNDAALKAAVEVINSDIGGWGFTEMLAPFFASGARIDLEEATFEDDGTSGFDLETGLFYIEGAISFTVTVTIGEGDSVDSLVTGGVCPWDTELDRESYPEVFAAAAARRVAA